MNHYIVTTVNDELYLVLAESEASAISDYDYAQELEEIRLATKEEVVLFRQFPHDVFYNTDLLNED